MKNTAHSGANRERTAVLAKIRRDRKRYSEWTAIHYIARLERWLLGRVSRNKKRKGGL